MTVKTYTGDSLRAFLGGLGDPERDKRAGVYYGYTFTTDDQLLNAYRGSWLPRKIVNIPAHDSVRAWRNWQAEQDQIEKIEAEEKRLGLRQKVKEAMIKARLLGGAAIVIGDGSSDLSKPFEPERIGMQGIKYLTVMSRVRLTAGEMETDPASEYFDQPKFYRSTSTGDLFRTLDIHPSRLVRFMGAPHPEAFYSWGVSNGWGDSVLTAVFDAIKNFDGTAANIASLVFEANVDVLGIPDLIDQLNDPRYVTALQTRMALAAANKGINRSIMKDAAETFERKQITFGGLSDILNGFITEVSGAADIPATRLFGMSPAGMNSTGESDTRNYYDHINSEQELTVEPAMNLLDEALIRSALGQRDEDIWYEWAPLWQISDKEKAENADKMAKVAETLGRTGLISQPALSAAVINQFTEDGIYPGLEAAAEDDPVDFDAMLEHEAKMMKKEEAPDPVKKPFGDHDPRFVKDAAPKPLYIQRKVKNAKDIIAWAKAQGFDTTLTAIDMHVTVAFSRDPVDWFAVGEPWSSELKIEAGGPRMVEQFNGGAIVLLFACNEVLWRHRKVMDVGGSHDYAEFQPHITISYSGERMDVSKIDPYRGEIILGPELFEELRDGWKATIKEQTL
jgi:phage-related protein (TIGR01555 family)